MSTSIRNRLAAGAAAGISLAVLTLGSGCATRNEPLERARSDYEQARQNVDVAKYAPVALAEAGETLRAAEQADSRDETTQLAYIASRKVEIARATAEEKMAENEAKQLLEDRDKMLLDLRERQLRELQARETERGFMVTLGDVLFETASATLKPGAQQKLSQLVAFLQGNPDLNVLVEGHADSRGSEAYNEDLSQRRAEAVQDFLIRSGIEPQRIIARGYGEAYPVASNATAAGRLQNRRVEIYFSESGKPVAERQR
jgi:OmpA-OmpF porin, OOP family